MQFHYNVFYTKPDTGRRYQADCVHSVMIADMVAKKRVSEGCTDVVIVVTPEDGDNPDDPTWPPIEPVITSVA